MFTPQLHPVFSASITINSPPRTTMPSRSRERQTSSLTRLMAILRVGEHRISRQHHRHTFAWAVCHIQCDADFRQSLREQHHRILQLFRQRSGMCRLAFACNAHRRWHHRRAIDVDEHDDPTANNPPHGFAVLNPASPARQSAAPVTVARAERETLISHAHYIGGSGTALSLRRQRK